MNGLFAQAVESAAPADWLERFPTEEVMVMVIVLTVFTALFLIVVTWCVTNTIRTIYVASSNARMAESLSQQGVPAEQIERLVRANWRKGRLISLCIPQFGRRWREPTSAAAFQQTMHSGIPPVRKPA
jgi:hypothetical protein